MKWWIAGGRPFAIFLNLNLNLKLNTMSEKNSFPTKPDKDGFYYESEEDKELDISVKVYENGQKVKKVILPGGCTCIVRTLKGRDNTTMQKILQGNKTLSPFSCYMHLAADIDGKKLAPEDWEELDLKIYNRVFFTVSDLNF